MGSERQARALRSSKHRIRRLVAHDDWGWQRPRGIHDGDPVAPCAPCARIRAGYWCADCSEGFGRDHDDPEGLPVGTIVERFGLGIAPRFAEGPELVVGFRRAVR